MTTQDVSTNELVGQVVLKLTQLAEEDLPLVVEFVNYLSRQRQTVPSERLSVARIRAKARLRTQELKQVPRTEIVARFQKLAEDIRQTAIDKNTAIEGDWPDD